MCIIEEFIARHLVEEKGAIAQSKAVSEAYIKFSGSTVGKNIMHKKLCLKFLKIGKAYHGFYIKAEDKQVSVDSTPKLSEYERQCLEIKKRKLELAAEKKASEEKIAAEKKASEEKIAADKIKLKKELKEIDERIAAKIAAQKASLEKEKMAQAERFKQLDLLEKEKDRAFMREENNKPRVLTILSKGFNPYFDLVGYGNNSKQFIDSSSLKKVIGFSQFDNTNVRDLTIEHKIGDIVESESEDKIIYSGEDSSIIRGIDSEKVSEVLDKIEIDEKAKEDVLAQVSEICNAPKDSSKRLKIPKLDSLRCSQLPDVNSSCLDKKKYIRAINKLRFVDNKIMINCYCCDDEYPLDSPAIHRSHNIPKSRGGDWSKENIYLCCSSCNQDMGNEITVLDYKLDLYLRID